MKAKVENIMTEAQVGEQRSSIIDHIITMKELIKLAKKEVYIAHLNMTNSHDKPDAIMYVMRSEGLWSKLWRTLKSLNENLISRKNMYWKGKKRKMNIIRQSSILGALEFIDGWDRQNIKTENIDQLSENK